MYDLPCCVSSYTIRAYIYVYNSMNIFIIHFNRCKSKTVSKNKTVTTRVCEVNTTAIYEECIPDNTTVFLLESPKDLPAQVICYWNVPKSQRTYTNLLQQDILGMPPAGCLNKLITVESGNNFRASCGDISFASKALRLTNELTPGSPDIIYLREYESNDTFSILFVLLVSVMALLYMTICKVSNVYVYIGNLREFYPRKKYYHMQRHAATSRDSSANFL